MEGACFLNETRNHHQKVPMHSYGNGKVNVFEHHHQSPYAFIWFWHLNSASSFKVNLSLSQATSYFKRALAMDDHAEIDPITSTPGGRPTIKRSKRKIDHGKPPFLFRCQGGQTIGGKSNSIWVLVLCIHTGLLHRSLSTNN